MNIFEAVFFVLALSFCLFNIWLFRKVRGIKVLKLHLLLQQAQLKKLNRELAEEIEQKEKFLLSVRVDCLTYNKRISDKKLEIAYLSSNFIRQQSEMSQNLEKFYQQEKTKTDQKLSEYKKVTKQAAENYIDTLLKSYETAEAAHKVKMTLLKDDLDKAAAALQALKDTRKAAYDAVLKLKLVKLNKNNYRLIPSAIDMLDISALERIKLGLHKPRILSMLIWQTYWQPLAKEKFPIILQAKTKTGIYKITNINTDLSYIGQSLDIYKRWTDHCKAGLGIDTPAGNKLYKSIQEDGLLNFTFEILCECPKDLLNDKEKYFILLYQADVYGFNGNTGIK